MNIALETNYLNNVAKELEIKWENILAESVVYHTDEINRKFKLILWEQD